MASKPHIILVAGPTASGKSAAAIKFAKERSGEVISVDSRQVYRRLDIGTEKMSVEEMQGIPHHLIDIREPNELYSANDFVQDAEKLIADITTRGKTPILAGGTHFYFDALLYGLPNIEPNEAYRSELEQLSTEELGRRVAELDPRRFADLDPQNRRRLIRALEIIASQGSVPERENREIPYEIEWHIINPPKEELRPRIDARLAQTLERGLIEEVRKIRAEVGDDRLNELGLEYRVVGEYVRDERSEDSLLPVLSSKLWHYARRQKAWLRKLADAQA
jgi:tRNA dimethylallyltransferase